MPEISVAVGRGAAIAGREQSPATTPRRTSEPSRWPGAPATGLPGPSRRDGVEPERAAHRRDRSSRSPRTGARWRERCGRSSAKESFALVLTSPLAGRARPASWRGSATRAVVEPDLEEWNYGEYEGLTPEQIDEKRPGWMIFRDGCPGGETPDADRRARRSRDRARRATATGDVALFAHGHVFRVLVARWIGLPPATASTSCSRRRR